MLGDGVQEDKPRACALFAEAAEDGCARAHQHLGSAYHNGDGVVQSYPKALALFELAATQGSTEAQFNLAQMHARGRGCDKDVDIAMELYTLSAANGHAEAQCELAFIHTAGDHGVPVDHAVAVGLFQMAADQGHGMVRVVHVSTHVQHPN